MNYYGKEGNGRKRKMTKAEKENPTIWDVFYYDQEEYLVSNSNLKNVRLRMVRPGDSIIPFGKSEITAAQVD